MEIKLGSDNILILIFVIGLLIFGVGIFIYLKDGNDTIYCSLNAIGIIISSLAIIFGLIVTTKYVPIITIDDKIEIYQNENSKIEQQISVIVDNYMEHESKTFKDVKDKDTISLISMFPELKSDKLVAKQINVYVKNNEKIKALECEKLRYRIYAWWLFFGH